MSLRASSLTPQPKRQRSREPELLRDRVNSDLESAFEKSVRASPQRTLSRSPSCARSASRLSAAAAGVPASAVRVVVRLRPPVTAEEQEHPHSFLVEGQQGGVRSTDGQFQFQFDHAFDPFTTQEELYNSEGKPVVEDVLHGYNGTILAYGQTGSGKTYCMFGPQANSNSNSSSMDLAGLVPRAARQLFAHIEREWTPDVKFTLWCSFYEVYCEQLRDLMRPNSGGLRSEAPSLQVKEVPPHGFYVDGLSHRIVSSAAETMNVLKAGMRLRAAANTTLNHHSSRSHALFTLSLLEQRSATDPMASSEGWQRAQAQASDHQGAGGSTFMVERQRKLTLVDLAGSEKVHKSGSTGEMLEEAKKINSSLSALGNVIDALADRRPRHIPYRDSRLTRLLEDSLGGNCRTTLLVACSPCTSQYHETLSSLRFAARAKKVCNYASRLSYSASGTSLKDSGALTASMSQLMTLPSPLRERGCGGQQEPAEPLPPSSAASGIMGTTSSEDHAPPSADQRELDRQLLARVSQLQRDLASAHADLRRRFSRGSPGQSQQRSPRASSSSCRSQPRTSSRSSWTEDVMLRHEQEYSFGLTWQKPVARGPVTARLASSSQPSSGDVSVTSSDLSPRPSSRVPPLRLPSKEVSKPASLLRASPKGASREDAGGPLLAKANPLPPTQTATAYGAVPTALSLTRGKACEDLRDFKTAPSRSVTQQGSLRSLTTAASGGSGGSAALSAASSGRSPPSSSASVSRSATIRSQPSLESMGAGQGVLLSSTSGTPFSAWRSLDDDDLLPATRLRWLMEASSPQHLLRSTASSSAASCAAESNTDMQVTLWFQKQLQLERNRCASLTKELERQIAVVQKLAERLEADGQTSRGKDGVIAAPGCHLKMSMPLLPAVAAAAVASSSGLPLVAAASSPLMITEPLPPGTPLGPPRLVGITIRTRSASPMPRMATTPLRSRSSTPLGHRSSTPLGQQRLLSSPLGTARATLVCSPAPMRSLSRRPSQRDIAVSSPQRSPLLVPSSPSWGSSSFRGALAPAAAVTPMPLVVTSTMRQSPSCPTTLHPGPLAAQPPMPPAPAAVSAASAVPLPVNFSGSLPGGHAGKDYRPQSPVVPKPRLLTGRSALSQEDPAVSCEAVAIALARGM
eukprot:TRINITY_DN2978_c0_g3_i1.p1 TRINITY_DN2978_c0_g3~~TRINITY_DN2978_c0_g3_i1.p1  ORF type:complete len:1141 (+),score=225.49 TRINITY_DN2978_c0_g3_i1:107-3529(+)